MLNEELSLLKSTNTIGCSYTVKEPSSAKHFCHWLSRSLETRGPARVI